MIKLSLKDCYTIRLIQKADLNINNLHL